jgi:hypothetical protein
MAQLHVLMGAETVRARPTIRKIGLADLKDTLAAAQAPLRGAVSGRAVRR